MANTNKRYEPEFKKQMVRLALEESRIIASVNKEYNLGEGTVRGWSRQYEEECEMNPEINEKGELYGESRRLRKNRKLSDCHIKTIRRTGVILPICGAAAIFLIRLAVS